MLVLKRKPGQFITVGNDVRVFVVGVDTTGVRLGIEAPKDIPIHRSEVAEQIVRDALASGEPLHRVEERLDHSDFEADMITAPRARAMAKQVATLQNALEYLRVENAELRAKLQDKEHVE